MTWKSSWFVSYLLKKIIDAFLYFLFYPFWSKCPSVDCGGLAYLMLLSIYRGDKLHIRNSLRGFQYHFLLILQTRRWWPRFQLGSLVWKDIEWLWRVQSCQCPNPTSNGELNKIERCTVNNGWVDIYWLKICPL